MDAVGAALAGRQQWLIQDLEQQPQQSLTTLRGAGRFWNAPGLLTVLTSPKLVTL